MESLLVKIPEDSLVREADRISRHKQKTSHTWKMVFYKSRPLLLTADLTRVKERPVLVLASGCMQLLKGSASGFTKTWAQVWPRCLLVWEGRKTK